MSEPSREQIAKAVMAFLNNGQTWAEKKRIVEAQRDVLLTDTADQVLADLILQYQDDDEVIRNLQLHRELLIHCRHAGIDDAFFPLLMPDITQEFLDLVMGYINAEIGEAKQLVKDRQKELLSDAAFQVFQLLIKRHRNDEKLRSGIEHRFTLLKRCRLEGIDAAFADQIVAVSQEVFKAIETLLEAQTPEEQRQLIERQQEKLLSDETDQVLVFLIAAARDEDNPNNLMNVRKLQSYRALLDRCRCEGIATVFADLLTPTTSQQTIESVMAFINAQEEEEQKHIVEAQGDVLLTDAADEFLVKLLSEYKDDQEAITKLQGYRVLLARCRRDGIDSAFAGRQQLLNLLENLPDLKQPNEMPHKIEMLLRTLSLVDRDKLPILWGALQTELGDSLAQSSIGDRANNLEEAIQHYQLALEVFDPPENWVVLKQALGSDYGRDPGNWAATQSHMGIAYMQRIKGNRADNLELAIEHFQLAQKVFTREATPENWVGVMGNLCETYRYRICGTRTENIELAIKFGRLALEVATRETLSEAWAKSHIDLGNAFLFRVRGDRVDNLEQAHYHYQQALDIYTHEADPIMWAHIQHNLASVFLNQPSDKSKENIEQAIVGFQVALNVLTQETFPADWAFTQNSLASAYVERLKGDRAQNLKNAMEHYRLALEVYTRDADPERWAMTQTNLGSVLSLQVRGDHIGDLEESIRHYKLALEVYTREVFPERWATVQYNLGLAYTAQAGDEQTGNFEQAIKFLRLALEIRTPNQFPSECREVLQSLGALYFSKRRWMEASAAYEEAIAVGEVLFEASYIETSRQIEVSETSRLYINAAYCQLKLGYPVNALIRLEQGKTRLLAEALALGETNLAILSTTQQKIILDQVVLLRELDAEMRLSPDTPGRRSDAELGLLLQKVRSYLNRLITNIRSEQPDFMPTNLDMSGILALVPENGATIAPLITSQGSAVFVLPYELGTVTEEHVILLDSLDSQTFLKFLVGTEHKDGWLSSYVGWREDGTLHKWMQDIEDFTHRLWVELLEPIQDKLVSLGVTKGAPVVIMPQGGLGLLPLHAAWRLVNGEKRAFLDDYIISYAPSAYALNTSQQRLRDQRRHQHSLVAVVNPTFDLPYTIIESEAVATLFTSATLQMLTGSQATQEAVVAAAPRTYLHFACHGFYNWSDPRRSGLVLADELPLLLSEILSPRFDLNIGRLVTLSACETGLTEYRQSPDEYIGLPAGFLQAGAPAVVSSLWAVSDLSTALLMERFYYNHLKEEMNIAAALRKAQLWVRNLRTEEVTNHVELWYQQSPQKNKSGLLKWVLHYRYLAHQNPDSRPFAHPYYWAAFTVNGL